VSSGEPSNGVGCVYQLPDSCPSALALKLKVFHLLVWSIAGPSGTAASQELPCELLCHLSLSNSVYFFFSFPSLPPLGVFHYILISI